MKVLNNTLEVVRPPVTVEGPSDRPEKEVPDGWMWTKYDSGRFEIRDNRITRMDHSLVEVPRDSEILGTL